ncbi:unnamed protein product [Aphanomyces euteiches]
MRRAVPIVAAVLSVHSTLSSTPSSNLATELDNQDAFKGLIDTSSLKDICRTHYVRGDWWHYEWCHEKHVRQFALDRVGGEETDSISLGTFSRKFQSVYEANGDERAYTSHLFLQGDMCHSGQPTSQVARNRSTEVRFTCCTFRPSETYIESVTEPRLCDYLVTVCTPDACHNPPPTSVSDFNATNQELADTVKRMFYHAYDSYMTHAFPLDNLKPMSCSGENFELGKIPMLTLIDTLDTLVVFGDHAEFHRAVELVTSHASFDLDTEVSVFETTIRVLGGLLSAHLFAIDPTLNIYANETYSGGLLKLAVDLGDRLLPAFLTKTGIPYGTVNVRRGVPTDETPIASTAGAGSLTMEFTMLSVLTKNPIYANAARTAVRGLFVRRSALGLLGKHIHAHTGEWTETLSGPGSNSDSFYEYLIKMYTLYGDTESLSMFDAVYSAVMEHNKHGDWYGDVNMWDGCSTTQSFTFDNLVAFWPGMQSLLGEFKLSSRSLNAFYQVWQKYSFLPEQFDVVRWRPKKAQLNGYPLRPELVESTYYMYRSTRDPSWLQAGAIAVESLERYSKTTCGYASIADVETKTQEDTMPSFFLSETCKYLYLLFDDKNFMHQRNYVFTTEAHPFPVLPTDQVEPILQASPALQSSVLSDERRMCPVLPSPFFLDLRFRRQFTDGFELVRPRCRPPTSSPSTKRPVAPSTSSVLHGGKELGEFKVEQLVGGFRARRLSKNSQWMKVSNLGDPKIVVEYQREGSTTSEFRVYDFPEKLTRRCRLLLADGTTISCSAALFGLTSDDSISISIENAPAIYGSPENGCSPLAEDSSHNRIIILMRGQCYFEAKAKAARKAGAVAVVVINTDTKEEMMIMGRSFDVGVDDLDIPAVMVPIAAEAKLREAVANNEPISLEYGIVTAKEFPSVEGSQDDMTVWGPDGWGLRLAAKNKGHANKAPLWTISIADAQQDNDTSEDRGDDDGINDQLLEKLKFLGFSDEQIALVNSDDGNVRMEALVDGLRALGLDSLADQIQSTNSEQDSDIEDTEFDDQENADTQEDDFIEDVLTEVLADES